MEARYPQLGNMRYNNRVIGTQKDEHLTFQHGYSIGHSCTTDSIYRHSPLVPPSVFLISIKSHCPPQQEAEKPGALS